MLPSSRCLPLVALSLAAACTIPGGEEPRCGDAELLPEICEAIESAAAGGKADEIPALRGVVVEKVGNRTLFKIPLAYTVGGDQGRLLDETIHKFGAELGRLNRQMIERGVDLAGVMDLASSQEFSSNYLQTLERVLEPSIEDEMEVRLGQAQPELRELWAWERYLVPQAFGAYFGAKFTANIGVGAGVSATILIVAQPWLALEVDHTLAEPTVVDKSYEVDVAVMGVPNIDVGFGVGGGMPIRIGAGAVFGPLDHPGDLAGWGVGLSGSFSLPIAGGGTAKAFTVLRRPPLFAVLLGYSTGTAAGFEVHGNLNYVMDLDDFLSWVSALTGTGK